MSEIYLTAESPVAGQLYQFGGLEYANAFPVLLPDGSPAMFNGLPVVKVAISTAEQEAALRVLPECLGSMLDMSMFHSDLARQICTVPVMRAGAEQVVAVADVAKTDTIAGAVMPPVIIAGGE